MTTSTAPDDDCMISAPLFLFFFLRYVFLLLYRLTKDKKYLHRAHEFANFIFTQEFQSKARTPDNPYSLYEGLAGTVCFMVDLLQPEKAAYPFFDVF